MSDTAAVIYRSQREQWVSIPFGVVIALLGLAGLSAAEDPIFPAVLVGAGVLWVARCCSSFRLEITESHLIVKRFGRTARIALSEILRVDTEVREPGVGAPRRCLRVTRRDATVRTFPEINGSDRSDRHELDDAIGRVRAALG